MTTFEERARLELLAFSPALPDGEVQADYDKARQFYNQIRGGSL